MVRFLMEFNADVNAMTTHGETPLLLAVNRSFGELQQASQTLLILSTPPLNVMLEFS